jgi:hypothetical protein
MEFFLVISDDIGNELFFPRTAHAPGIEFGDAELLCGLTEYDVRVTYKWLRDYPEYADVLQLLLVLRELEEEHPDWSIGYR